MNDFLSQIDAASPANAPALCLLLADWLDERGEPSEGWRALGVLGKCPYRDPTHGDHTWFRPLYRGDQCDEGEILGRPWLLKFGRLFFPSRSAALTAAAEAFVRLPDGTKREIMGQVEHSLRG